MAQRICDLGWQEVRLSLWCCLLGEEEQVSIDRDRCRGFEVTDMPEVVPAGTCSEVEMTQSRCAQFFPKSQRIPFSISVFCVESEKILPPWPIFM